MDLKIVRLLYHVVQMIHNSWPETSQQGAYYKLTPENRAQIVADLIEIGILKKGEYDPGS